MSANVVKEKKVKEEKIITPGLLIWRRFRRNKLAIVGATVLIIIMIACIFGPMISPHEMNGVDVTKKYLAPNSEHWLGTDNVGRDILTRMLLAGRVSIMVGILSSVISLIIGTILGCISGFYGGKVDFWMMRLVDIMMCIPHLPILITLGVVLMDWNVPPEHRLYYVMLILGFLSWAGICRLVRGQILSLREQEFMQAADALGLSDARKIFKHILPNVIPIVIVSATLGIAGGIIYEATLSYLGLGVIPPTPSWGNMLQAARSATNMSKRLWLWVPPGMCILCTCMAINFLGDGLRDAIDPKMKR